MFYYHPKEDQKNQNLLIIGCGGHGKVVAEIAELKGYSQINFFDENESIKKFMEKKTYSSIQENFSSSFFIAIGDNYTRELFYLKFLKKYVNALAVNLFHPSCIISKRCEIGFGNVFMSNAIINSSSKIGNGVILNTGSTIDHDCYLDDFSSIAPGVSVGGNVKIGKRSVISIGAKIKHNISIGDDSVIGGCSFVNKNIGNNYVSYGIPAKEIRRRKKDEKYL